LWFADLKDKVRILSIDFHKPWTQVIKQQKKYLILTIMSTSFSHIFYTLVPLFIGTILETKNFNIFFLFILGWILALISEYATFYNTSLLEIQCINSVQYNAFKFLLTVDPIFHTTKSTGKLFAKIERGARSYEDFLDLLL